MEIRGYYFMGNEVSEYGKKYKRVDYATLAKGFNHVLNNEIMQKTMEVGYWDVYCGAEYYYEDENGNQYTEAEAEDLEGVELTEIYCDFYQFYIIDKWGAETLAHWTDETVWYNEELDMYVWGVQHCGTSWDYVLTDIKIVDGEE